MRTILSLIFAVLITSVTVHAQQKTTATDPRIGKKVIVTVAGASLRTPKTTVWKAYLGETFTIGLTNGEWLWIDEKGGWLWQKETVPFATAVKDLSARISKEPTAENYHLRGIAYAAHGQYDKAITDYSSSLKIKANDAGVLNNRGQAWYRKKDYANAIRDFNLAIRSDPKHFVAMNNRSLCHIATAKYDQALNDLNAAVKLNAAYPEALNNRGVVHSRKGNYKSAITDFSAALKIDSKYTDALGNRAFAYRKQGLVREAVVDLTLAMNQAALDYKPVNDLAWIHATTSNAKYRKPKEAVKLATKACEMTQYKDWNPLDTLAAACAANNDFKKAQEWIAMALENAKDTDKVSLAAHQKLFVANKALSE